MPRSIVLVCLLAAFVGSTLAFGSKLIHSAGRQTPLPITTTAATQDGWVKSNVPCDRYLGQAWNKKSPYPTSDTPITLYFAGNGQISGFGTDVFGIVETQWVTANFYKSISSVQYRIQAGTRDSSNASLCAPGPQFSEPIGDRVIINPGLIGYQIPSSDSDAKAGNWTKGACIDGMGTHWEYDLVSAPVQSYIPNNLLPVVPMYYQGKLNAVFFASTSVQQGLGNHQWDIIPIPGALMCKNFCGNCKYPSFSFWSTMHIWFGTTDIKCSSAC